MRCAECCFRDYDGLCNAFRQDDPKDPQSNSNLAGFDVSGDDDQGVFISLRVADDFGCVKFKAKTDIVD